MSYYGPEFANIRSGWYRATSNPTYAEDRETIDAAWDASCDEIVRRYVSCYGTFFTAFDEAMLHEVELATATSLRDRVRYYGHYFANRAWEMDDTRRQWRASQSAAETRSYRCSTCGNETRLVEAHPDLVRRHGIDLRVCRPCDYALRRYGGLGTLVLERVPSLMRTLAESRGCEICGHSFDLSDRSLPFQRTGSTDVLYPNLFASVCPQCFRHTFRDYRSGNSSAHLARLYDLFVYTGRVPIQDLGSHLYICRDHDAVMRTLELLGKTRTPEGYADEFGSFFAALVASGILPDGSKKLAIGTMLLATDGHLCLSVPEKEIDDYLSAHGLPHEKEVGYPGCSYRCDWEILADPDHRTFVEYFGLMENPDYARRAREKLAVAHRADIELVALYPDTDWMAVLSGRFRL